MRVNLLPRTILTTLFAYLFLLLGGGLIAPAISEQRTQKLVGDEVPLFCVTEGLFNALGDHQNFGTESFKFFVSHRLGLYLRTGAEDILASAIIEFKNLFQYVAFSNRLPNESDHDYRNRYMAFQRAEQIRKARGLGRLFSAALQSLEENGNDTSVMLSYMETNIRPSITIFRERIDDKSANAKEFSVQMQDRFFRNALNKFLTPQEKR